MEKPIALRIAELRNTLINTLNESNLPPCIVEPVVKEVYEVAAQARSNELLQAQNTYSDENSNANEQEEVTK
jgi:hypothetical protein